MILNLLPYDAFHGTSSFFAEEILNGKNERTLASIDLKKLCGSLYADLLAAVEGGHEHDIWTHFSDMRRAPGAGVTMALCNTRDGKKESLAAYGSFYATLAFELAASYAIKPFGSELLTYINESLNVLRKLDVPVERYFVEYPSLQKLLKVQHKPVVLVMRGLPFQQLDDEWGNNKFSLDLYEKLKGMGLGGTPTTMRIAVDVSPYVTAVRRILGDFEYPRGTPNWDELTVPEFLAWVASEK